MKHISILWGTTILLTFSFCTGCSKIVDPIVVPIDNATRDLNRTKENISMPMEIFPGAEVHVKGTKLAIEKNF